MVEEADTDMIAAATKIQAVTRSHQSRKREREQLRADLKKRRQAAQARHHSKSYAAHAAFEEKHAEMVKKVAVTDGDASGAPDSEGGADSSAANAAAMDDDHTKHAASVVANAEEEHAAIKIQAMERGRRQRQRLNVRLERRRSGREKVDMSHIDGNDPLTFRCATWIQAIVRSRQSRRQQQIELKAELRRRQAISLKRLQARGKLASNSKKMAETLSAQAQAHIAEQTSAAIKIQAVERRRAQRAAMKESEPDPACRRELRLLQPFPESPEEEEEVKEEFTSSLAEQLGIDPSRIMIKSIKPGSIIIDFFVLDAATAAAKSGGTTKGGQSETGVDVEAALHKFDRKVQNGEIYADLAHVGAPRKRRCCGLLAPKKPLTEKQLAKAEKKRSKAEEKARKEEEEANAPPQPRAACFMTIPFVYAAIFGLGGILMMAAVAAKMGPERTRAWLIASMISLAINILIVQPLQVIVLAAFIQLAENSENAVLEKIVDFARNIGQ